LISTRSWKFQSSSCNANFSLHIQTLSNEVENGQVSFPAKDSEFKLLTACHVWPLFLSSWSLHACWSPPFTVWRSQSWDSGSRVEMLSASSAVLDHGGFGRF
jgi:hypothetical protein